jgi:integrase
MIVGERPAVEVPVGARPLAPLIAAYTGLYGASWRPVTRAKHAADFRRLLDWLSATGRPTTTASLDVLTLVGYVEDLRTRPKVSGWRGAPDARARSLAAGSTTTLSANSIHAYMRPLRSLAIWLVDEGLLASDPFRRAQRRSGRNGLLPREDTPTKSATLADLQALARGCTGSGALDLRDQAILAIFVTTGARNSGVRLLAVNDVDFQRSLIRFRRGKGAKTLELALHPAARSAVARYLEHGRARLLEPAVPDPGYLFLSANRAPGPHPLTSNALSLMLTRRYHAGGGSIRCFGSHRIRHGTATLLVNAGMPLDEVSRFLGHSSTQVTRRYAVQTSEALGARAAEALARAGVVSG